MTLLAALDKRLAELRHRIGRAYDPDRRWDLQTEELAVMALRNMERAP